MFERRISWTAEPKTGSVKTQSRVAPALSIAVAGLLLAATLSGCIAVGGYRSGGGGWFFWPGGLGVFLIILLFLLLRRRRRTV